MVKIAVAIYCCFGQTRDYGQKAVALCDCGKRQLPSLLPLKTRQFEKPFFHTRTSKNVFFDIKHIPMINFQKKSQKIL